MLPKLSQNESQARKPNGVAPSLSCTTDADRMKRLLGAFVVSISIYSAHSTPLEQAARAPAPAESQSAYLHFPHSFTRVGSSFLPGSDVQQSLPSFVGLEPPEEPTNPAYAWARHPLAEAPSLPREKLQPGRRALLTPQADAPYPPAACKFMRTGRTGTRGRREGRNAEAEDGS